MSGEKKFENFSGSRHYQYMKTTFAYATLVVASIVFVSVPPSVKAAELESVTTLHVSNRIHSQADLDAVKVLELGAARSTAELKETEQAVKPAVTPTPVITSVGIGCDLYHCASALISGYFGGINMNDAEAVYVVFPNGSATYMSGVCTATSCSGIFAMPAVYNTGVWAWQWKSCQTWYAYPENKLGQLQNGVSFSVCGL